MTRWPASGCSSRHPSEQVIAATAERLYLDRSIPERYWLWLTGIGGNGDIGLLQGQLGPSVRGGAFDIGAEVAGRIGITLRLVGASIVLSIGFGILAGVYSALRQYSVLDYGLTFFGFVCLAMPVFWVGALVRELGVFVNRRLEEPIFFVLGVELDRHPRVQPLGPHRRRRRPPDPADDGAVPGRATPRCRATSEPRCSR